MHVFRQKDTKKLPHSLDYWALHAAGLLNSDRPEAVWKRISQDEETFKSTADKRAFLTQVWNEFNAAIEHLNRVGIHEAMKARFPDEFVARKALGKDSELVASVGDWDCDNKQLFVVDSTKYERLELDFCFNRSDGYASIFKIADESSSEFSPELKEIDLDTGAVEDTHALGQNHLLLAYAPYMNLQGDDGENGYMEFCEFADGIGYLPMVESDDDPEAQLAKSPISYVFQIDKKPFRVTDNTPEKRIWLVWPASALCVMKMPRAKLDIKQVLSWLQS